MLERNSATIIKGGHVLLLLNHISVIQLLSHTKSDIFKSKAVVALEKIVLGFSKLMR